MNREELKQKAKITNKDIKTNLKYSIYSSLLRKLKFNSSMISVPTTIKAKGMMIAM